VEQNILLHKSLMNIFGEGGGGSYIFHLLNSKQNEYKSNKNMIF